MESNNASFFKDIAKQFRSEVWKFFHYSDKLEKGLCLKCQNMLSAKDHSTKVLLNHLKLKHGIDLRRQKEDCVAGPSFKKMKSYTTTKIHQYLAGKLTDGNVIAELAAVDRFSFNQIAKSKPLRKGLRALAYEISGTRQGVAKVFMKQFANEKMRVDIEIKEFGNQRIRVAVTLDDPTNISMKRMYNLNIHYA